MQESIGETEGRNLAAAVGHGFLGFFQAFRGIDGASIALEGKAVKPAGGDEFDEDIAGQVSESAGRDVIQDLRFAHADAGVDPGRGDMAPGLIGGAFEEIVDSVFGIEADDAVGSASLVDEEGGQGGMSPMKLEHSGKILVGENVAVLDKKGFTLTEEGLHFFETAGGAQEGGFVRVSDPQVPAGAVAAVFLDDLGKEMEVDDDIIDALGAEVAQEKIEERPVLNGQHGLGQFAGEMAQSRAHTGA